MTSEDVAQISFHAIRAEAMRGSAGTAEKLGHYVRGVIQVYNGIVARLTKEEFKSFIYADTDSVKSEYWGGFTHCDHVKEDPDET